MLDHPHHQPRTLPQRTRCHALIGLMLRCPRLGRARRRCSGHLGRSRLHGGPSDLSQFAVILFPLDRIAQNKISVVDYLCHPDCIWPSVPVWVVYLRQRTPSSLDDFWRGIFCHFEILVVCAQFSMIFKASQSSISFWWKTCTKALSYTSGRHGHVWRGDLTGLVGCQPCPPPIFPSC